MVVWIEISYTASTALAGTVTTCVVVWIEISDESGYLMGTGVTTCVVVWIEISILCYSVIGNSSPPAWWCGLKWFLVPSFQKLNNVTTCVVVWIEITVLTAAYARWASHHLRGGVD